MISPIAKSILEDMAAIDVDGTEEGVVEATGSVFSPQSTPLEEWISEYDLPSPDSIYAALTNAGVNDPSDLLELTNEDIGTNEYLKESNKCLKKINKTLQKSHGHDALLGFSYLYDMRTDLQSYPDPIEICLHHWNHHLLPQLSDIIFSNQITSDNLKKVLEKIKIPNASLQVNGTKFDKEQTIESPRNIDRLQLELVPSNG